MEMQARPCPICGCSDNSRLFLESNYSEEKTDAFSYSSRKIPESTHLRMLLCVACDLLYASPAPSAEVLENAYREAEFDSAEEAGFASQTYSRIVSGILSKLPDKDGALDIGTGDGAFLERLLEHGFTNIKGIEPSEAPVLSAKPHIQPLILPGLFDPGRFCGGSFSLITSFQTLEHVENPKKILESVFSLLKPGGAFVTVSHNFRSMSARLLGHKSPIYDIEHLQLYSIASLSRLLMNSGLSAVAARPISNTYPLHYWLKMLPIDIAMKKRLIGLTKTAKLGYWPISVPAGNISAIGYKNV